MNEQMHDLKDFANILQVAVGVGLAYSLVSGVRTIVFSLLRDQTNSLLYYYSAGLNVAQIEDHATDVISRIEQEGKSQTTPSPDVDIPGKIDAIDEISDKLLASRFFLRRCNMVFGPLSGFMAIATVTLMTYAHFEPVLLSRLSMIILLGVLLCPVPLAIVAMALVALWYYFQMRRSIVTKLANMKEVRRRRREIRSRILQR